MLTTATIVTLFTTYAPYIIALKLCSAVIDIGVTYVKHRITKEGQR